MSISFSNGSKASVTFAGNADGGIDVYEATFNGEAIDELGGPGTPGSESRIDPARSLVCAGPACAAMGRGLARQSLAGVAGRGLAISFANPGAGPEDIGALGYVGLSLLAIGAYAITDYIANEMSEGDDDSSSEIRQPSKPDDSTGGSGAPLPPNPDEDPNDIDQNKLHHIFGNQRHQLDDLVAEFGSRERAYEAIQSAATAHIRANQITGLFEESIAVGTQQITVRGVVINGAARIGTAFKPL